jgi:hypothetical protein
MRILPHVIDARLVDTMTGLFMDIRVMHSTPLQEDEVQYILTSLDWQSLNDSGPFLRDRTVTLYL